MSTSKVQQQRRRVVLQRPLSHEVLEGLDLSRPGGGPAQAAQHFLGSDEDRYEN